MRIFIGIKLADSVTASIQKFLEPFQKISTPVRWIKPKNIHLTLKFIGEVDQETYRNIESALSEPFADELDDTVPGSFDVELTGCGKFGKGTALSIFWIGIRPTPALTSLYQSIEERLDRIGIPKEDRPFKPHITVGRNKRHYNFGKFNELIEQYGDQRINRFPVSAIQLFKSKLTPDGPIYTILKEISLNHAQA